MLWTWRSSGNADVTHDHQEQKDESKLCLSGPQSSAETKASFHFRTGQIGFCLEKETADWAEQPVLFHHSRFYFCAVVVYIYKYPIWVEPDQMNVLPRHRFTPFSSVASELGVPLIALMCLACVQSAPPPAQVHINRCCVWRCPACTSFVFSVCWF